MGSLCLDETNVGYIWKKVSGTGNTGWQADIISSSFILPSASGQIWTAEIDDDGSASSGWPNRLEFSYKPSGGSAKLTSYFNEFGEFRGMSGQSSSVPWRLFTKNGPGDTAHSVNMMEVMDDRTTRTLLWGVDSTGKMLAPNIEQTVTFGTLDALTTRTGAWRWYNRTGVPLTIRAVDIQVGTVGPTGAAILMDLNISGTTAYTTQGNRPTIAAAAGAGAVAAATLPDVVTIGAGAYLTADIDQVGSTIAGTGLVLSVHVGGLT